MTEKHKPYWPMQKGRIVDTYKAVLLEVDGENYLRFSRESVSDADERHGEILKRFLI